MSRRANLFAVLLWSATTGHAQDDGGTIPFATDHTEMNAAISAAQESLPLFLCEATNSDGYGPNGGYLKVRVPVEHPNMTDEVIWVGPFAAWDGFAFAGILVNEPVAIAGYAIGDQLDFTFSMIVDWAWAHPSGAQYGDYTTRVIYRQIGDTNALASLADPPFDASWTCQ